MNVGDNMNMTKLCQQMFDASIQAGVVAIAMQKDIVNEGKTVEQLVDEDQLHYAMRAAKTKVDVMVQDMLLAALREHRFALSLDAEEESAYLQAYPNQHADATLILDPIDGTMEYINQQDTYSICSAIIQAGQVSAAVVYFPAIHTAYTYDPQYQARIFRQADLQSFTQGEQIVAAAKQLPKIVYKNDRVHSSLLGKLEAGGFRIIDDRTCLCPEALLRCMRQEAFCYIADTRNIRDILLGAILSNIQGGAAFDEHGEPLIWPARGRLAFGVFTMFPAEMKEYFK